MEKQIGAKINFTKVITLRSLELADRKSHAVPFQIVIWKPLFHQILVGKNIPFDFT